MHTYTALYDNLADAEAAQARLRDLGIIDADNNAVYDRSTAGFGADTTTRTDSDFWSTRGGAIPPVEDRRVYEESVRRGGYLLTVNVDDAYADRAHEVLENSNAVNVDEREREYRDAGYLPALATGAADTTLRTTAGTGEQAIPIVEEDIRVGKRQVERGGVRVRSYVVETPVREQVSLRQEQVNVERRAVDQPLRAGAAGDLLQNREIEMTETSEEAVVSKQARVVEEVVVSKDVNQRVEEVEDTVRRTEVEVDRTDGTTATDRDRRR